MGNHQWQENGATGHPLVQLKIAGSRRLHYRMLLRDILGSSNDVRRKRDTMTSPPVT